MKHYLGISIEEEKGGETNSKNSKRLRFSLDKYLQVNQSNALKKTM